MSKTTKIIAALGVVASLGVAALPAFTYATSTTGDVQVVVEVDSAIAMTIEGNNDSGSHKPESYTVVAEPDSGSMGSYYERSGAEGSYAYTLTEDSTPASGKTYYTKDADLSYAKVDNAAPTSPVSVAGKTLDGHSIPATLVPGTSSSYASLLPNSTVAGGEFKSTITVFTNNATGYSLTVKDKDANTALTSSNGSTIAAGTNIAAGTSAWAYRVASINGSADGTTRPGTAIQDPVWVAVNPSTGQDAEITRLDTKTSGGDQTVVEYGVSTSGDQATGIYGDVIVYTATTK
ncbi:hypothetical protein J6S35_02580 [Candidatus Saccharibacteria bacterium]|nr:hypothetical protein [Candidatus Saccharibacteria bacterium]